MRREIFRMSAADALRFLVAAPYVHLATTSPDGDPILRSVHAIELDGALYFHGAPVGEKHLALGRACVMSAEHIVSELPSTFMGPDRACPATTLYESVQAHGTLAAYDDVLLKARVLQRLMERYQPQGGHVPIHTTHPRYQELYAAAVKGISIVGMTPNHIDGKAKLAQNRTPLEVCSIIDSLWRRGNPTDACAIERVRAANPTTPTPVFLTSPAPGITLSCAVPHTHAAAASALLADAYWCAEFSAATLIRAHQNAAAWVGAFDSGGVLVGSARAVSDGARIAWVMDVIVRADWRRRGIATALTRLLLDHPAVRDAAKVLLRTRDARSVYTPLGFVDAPPSPFGEMVLSRAAATEG